MKQHNNENFNKMFLQVLVDKYSISISMCLLLINKYTKKMQTNCDYVNIFGHCHNSTLYFQWFGKESKAHNSMLIWWLAAVLLFISRERCCSLNSGNIFGLAALFSNQNVIGLSGDGWSTRAEPLICVHWKVLLCLCALWHSLELRDWTCYYCSWIAVTSI